MDIEHLHLTVQKLEMWRSVYYVLIENRLNVYHNKYLLPLEYWQEAKVLQDVLHFLEPSQALFGIVFTKNIWLKMAVVLARKKHQN